ncbi:P-loop containing nucleoside triphosphate hydrolase protein [Trametes maxima]|nr:P-loop containing nucleoside triphosphate hydrolase protein [Trametes maxima]
MDAADVLQTVLSVIQSGSVANMTSEPSSATNATVTSVPSGPASPPGLSQLLVLLFSTAAIRDWAKLLLIGAFLEACRRGLNKSWESIGDFFWLTATFDLSEDPADWVLYWLSQRKVFHTARQIEVSSYYYGLDDSTTSVDNFGEGEDADKVSYYPSMNRTYTLWYRGRYMTIRRENQNEGSYFRRPIQVLELRILSRDSNILRSLLLEAHREYKKAIKDRISVSVAENADQWRVVAVQEKRPSCSVILDPGVYELIVNDARDFLQSRQWYADRGIPFRRGYLLHGAPGAGKTSLIHSIAGELHLSIYILSLTMISLDDNSLKALIARLPQACIVLIEDIDAAFHRGMKRNIADPEKQARGDIPPPEGGSDEGSKKQQDAMFSNGVTLSGLLNALDGIAAQEGRILFATTNDYTALDPALLRPGRLDLHIEFHLASRYQARELFKRFYAPDEKVTQPPTHTRGADDSVPSPSSTDSSTTTTPRPPSTEDREKLAATATHTDAAPSLPESVRSVYVGMTQTGTGWSTSLTSDEALALADRFAEVIPPQTFSMATLQGYLMAYKFRPVDALADAPAWVEKRLREKASAEEKKGGADGSPHAVVTSQ